MTVPGAHCKRGDPGDPGDPGTAARDAAGGGGAASSDDGAAAATDGDVFLAVEGVHKRFGGVHALRGIDLALRRGRIYHLLGENGCGKSTIIKIISGAQPPDAGVIRLQGQDYRALTPLMSLQAGIETVYQDLSLLPNLGVAENVGLSGQLVAAGGALSHRIDRQALRASARRAVSVVGLPDADDFLDAPVADLPLALRQLVAIARAVATRARLVIMDEPTTSLTRREVDNLIRVVTGLQRDGVAVLFVTHKLDEAFRIGGDVIVFRDGQCVAQGPITDYTKARLGELMTGRQLDGNRYRNARPGTEVLLDVTGLAREPAFADLSLQVARGEILGITGLADSGRNEVALALAGVVPADRGEIAIAGRAVRIRRPTDAIASGIGYVPEDRLVEGLFLDKPIVQNMATLVLDRLRAGPAGLGGIDEKRARELANRLVGQLKIATPDVDLPVQSLSGGNQQRVLIGRWLTIEPRLLILHGPTVGVDVGSKDTIYRVIQALAEQGMGLIVISDDLPELQQNCDRILVMRQGRIAASFAPDAPEKALYDAMLASAPAACP